jgi:N-acetyl-1-D-myo-inositol-2-amino-2-deoxy-alpha-D-glucopyranoside deacetylase
MDEFEEFFSTMHTVMFAHAHPDDETLASGTLMAHLAAQGIRIVLLTATRGEEGEVVPGPLSALAGTDALVEQRAAELANAADVLGVTARAWLGQPPARTAGAPERRYRDSGMRWVRPGLAGPSDAARPDSLSMAAPDEVTGDVIAAIQAWHPDLVVSYDASGGYGHPDHVRIRESSLSAATICKVPFMELTADRSREVLWFDGSDRVDVLKCAIACHASQVRLDGEDLVHSGGQRTSLRSSVGLRHVPGAVRDVAGAGEREDSRLQE